MGGGKIALIALTSKCQPYYLNKNNICMKRAFLLRELGSAFFRVLFWLNDFLHSWQLNLLPTWVCSWLQSARPVANDFGHKSQELSFVIRTFQLATFPFARIRVFCNFTSWMWMINLLVLGWGSPNHQNKWENDLLLDIFFGDNDFDTLNLKNSLTHSHSNRALTITITL